MRWDDLVVGYVCLTIVLHLIDPHYGPSTLTMDEGFMANSIRGPCKASFIHELSAVIE